MEHFIEVRGLCKAYSDFALKDVNLSVPPGCIVGLIGENGAGKTTTLKAILNVIHPDKGEIRLMGNPATDDARAQIGVVWEDSYFDGSLCPKQINHIMAGICPIWDEGLFAAYCKRFGLPEKKRLKEFSRGMRIKLCLSTALARHPKLLILDEATSGLDPVIRGEILDLFLEFIQEEDHSILLSSHITSDLEKIADQIAYLHNGTVLFQQNKDELLESMAVVRCPANQLDMVPTEWIIAKQNGALGCAALVCEPKKAKRLLPNAIFDRVSIDDIMQFFARRDAS